MMCGSALQAQTSFWVDFSSLTQDTTTGPHEHPDYLWYSAGHEVDEDFVTMEYDAFGTSVSLTPAWPDSDGEVLTKQMIDRGTQDGFDEDDYPIVSGNDANWLEGDEVWLKEANTLDIVTDWLGVDTRIANGGNGDYDGEVGDTTRLQIVLSGIPAGEYSWTSFHHDTENIHTPFLFDYSVDGGSTFAVAGDGEYKMTNSSTGSNPPEPEIYQGITDDGEVAPLTDLPSTAQFTFNATGADVVLQFTPLAAEAVHTQIMGINAFQMEQLSTTGGGGCVVPVDGIAGDLDGDGTVAFADFLVLSQNFGSAGVPYASGDVDCDGTVAFADFLTLSQNFGQSAAVAQAVPEPAGFAMVAIGAVLIGLVRRRRS